MVAAAVDSPLGCRKLRYLIAAVIFRLPDTRIDIITTVQLHTGINLSW